MVRKWREVLAANVRDVFALTTDNWDDFGYKTQFHLAYIAADGSETRIGALKILQRAKNGDIAERTALPATFSELPEEFISLGQEDEYYLELRTRFGSEAERVVSALADISWRPALAIPFEPTTAFRNSLMRENTAHRARRFGRSWILGEPIHERFSFRYSCTIPGAEAAVDGDIDFDRKDDLPGRLVGIIGRNAVGKTRFLAQLGEDLAQVSRTSAEKVLEREQRFPGGRPLFTRVLAISYSAFDRFKRPAARDSSSYVYCGIRNEKGNLSKVSLIETYRANQQRIRALDRQPEWLLHMNSILGPHSAGLEASLQKEMADPSDDDEGLSLLSSGQAILCHFVTALLAWIQPHSLVLFDEPETHLHPNAVANLLVVLSEILRAYDSYCVVATHSPLVIQELPSQRVLVFQRAGNVTTSEPIATESFGESITELTKHVFETIEVESLYRRTLRQLTAFMEPQEVLARFPKGLSVSAQAYLLAQYGKRKQ